MELKEFLKLKVGDKVRIIDKDMVRECRFKDGTRESRCFKWMEDYCGDIMTIRETDFDNEYGPCVKMVEDAHENLGRDGWKWDPWMIAKKVDVLRVVCTESKVSYFTVGKVYERVDGVLTDDELSQLTAFCKSDNPGNWSCRSNVKFELYKEPTVKEVKRHAKTGEYIKIVERWLYEDRYENGDILKVNGEDAIEDGVYVDIDDPCDVWVFVCDDEYVVLEGYEPPCEEREEREEPTKSDKEGKETKQEYSLKKRLSIFNALGRVSCNAAAARAMWGLAFVLGEYSKFDKPHKEELNDIFYVKCTRSEGMRFTVGKIYTWNNGQLTDDYGFIFSRLCQGKDPSKWMFVHDDFEVYEEPRYCLIRCWNESSSKPNKEAEEKKENLTFYESQVRSWTRRFRLHDIICEPIAGDGIVRFPFYVNFDKLKKESCEEEKSNILRVKCISSSDDENWIVGKVYERVDGVLISERGDAFYHLCAGSDPTKWIFKSGKFELVD